MEILDVVQGSPEWLKVRAGIPSASNFDKIVTTKGEPSKQRQKYLYQLAGERITGIPEEIYQNLAMQRGLELETEARNLYQVINDEIVTEVGFCMAEGYGASPDGLVGEKGGLEIKCPTLAVHVGYLIEGILPTDYFQQVQGNLLSSGREWWDFMSYYPAMKPLIIRVKRDEIFLKSLKIELEVFCHELDRLVEKIR